MSNVVNIKRPPGTLAERFWSIAKSVGPSGDDTTNPEPKAIVRHVLRILDALSAGEVGDGVSQSTVSFLALLRQQEEAGDMSYASPEQARGETLDERSLVFSVGVLMFEELTGRHPFGAANNPRRFARIQKGELGSGVQYFPQVPGELRSVLMKAMGPFPEERYASLRELRKHLERFANDAPVGEPKPQRPQRLKGLPPTPAEIMFGAADENMATTVRAKVLPPVSPTPPQGAKSITAKVKSLDEEVAPKRNLKPILERLAWLGAGAALSLGVTLIFLPSRGKAPEAPAPAPAVETAAAKPAPAAAKPTVTPIEAPKAAAAAPAPKAAGLEAPSIDVAPPAAAGTFDLDVAGKNAMQVARECFGGRSVSFGAGLLFGKDDSVARKVYLSPDEPLSPEERKCVRAALATTSAGGPPDHNVTADYRFRIKGGDASLDKATFTIGK
jgi:hypothetical protein